MIGDLDNVTTEDLVAELQSRFDAGVIALTRNSQIEGEDQSGYAKSFGNPFTVRGLAGLMLDIAIQETSIIKD